MIYSEEDIIDMAESALESGDYVVSTDSDSMQVTVDFPGFCCGYKAGGFMGLGSEPLPVWNSTDLEFEDIDNVDLESVTFEVCRIFDICPSDVEDINLIIGSE